MTGIMLLSVIRFSELSIFAMGSELRGSAALKGRAFTPRSDETGASVHPAGSMRCLIRARSVSHPTLWTGFRWGMLDQWAYLNGVKIDVSRPGKPLQKSESSRHSGSRFLYSPRLSNRSPVSRRMTPPPISRLNGLALLPGIGRRCGSTTPACRSRTLLTRAITPTSTAVLAA